MQLIRYSSPNELVNAQEQSFLNSLTCNEITFAKESNFAIQLLNSNSYLAKIAMDGGDGQRSFISAVNNIASIGISLNPAKKHAYLVPRDGKVVLDISYLGMVDIATSSGSVLWVQAKIVYSNDTYENTGINTPPEHKFNAFGNRGEIVGVYCVAKTVGGDYLTNEMPIDKVHAIRARSQSFNKGRTSPWKTDYEEMVKKTCIKQGSKLWPKSDRLSHAIDYLNNNGEGIDFKSEK